MIRYRYLAATAALLIAPALPTDATAATTTGVAAIAKPAVVRGNQWFLKNEPTSGPGDLSFHYGAGGDIPFLADWDGDGMETPGVVRGNLWFLRNSRSTGVADSVFTFGDIGDRPIVGDWDGDGVDSPGVVRGNVWLLRNQNSTGTADVGFSFGDPADHPIVGDWDGDGDTTPGVTRASRCIDCTEKWFVRNENSTGIATALFDNQGAQTPVPGDWRGDGHTTPGWVEDARWFVAGAPGDSPTQFTFGLAGDVALSWK